MVNHPTKIDLYFFGITMSSYCLTDIKETMTIFTIIYNDQPLEFFIEHQLFKDYFKEQGIYTINCPEVSRKSFTESIVIMIDFLCTKCSDYSDVFNDNNVVMLMDIAFKNPISVLTKQSGIFGKYKNMIEVCNGSPDIPEDMFIKMSQVIYKTVWGVVSTCIIAENNIIQLCTGRYSSSFSGNIKVEYVTGPMCFFKNYGTLKKIKYSSSSKYDPKYDTPYSFDGNDYVKSLHRVLRYMLAKNIGFIVSEILDNRTQIKTLLSGPLFDNIVDTINFDEYIEYVDSLRR